MYQIRRGVFETNSSSSHSITIDRDKDNLTDFPKGQFIRNYPTLKVPGVSGVSGVLEMRGGEFGWGVEDFNDFETKFQYLVTHIFRNCTSESEVLSRMEDSEQFLMLKTVIKKTCDLEITPPEPSAYGKTYVGPVGYIDHQSVGTAFQVFISKEILKNYLFNKDSILFIDNDNY